VIDGGYQSYRNLVHDAYKDAVTHRLIPARRQHRH
jgi:hypothetical protein